MTEYRITLTFRSDFDSATESLRLDVPKWCEPMAESVLTLLETFISKNSLEFGFEAERLPS